MTERASSTEQVRKWRARNTAHQREVSRKYRAANRERIRKYARDYGKKYVARNKERIYARAAELRAKDPEHFRRIQRRSSWRVKGVDPVEAERVRAAHDGKCECCGTDKPKEARWCVDHDHKTGKVRGVLCSKCNTAIGKLGDTLEGVERAAEYLRKHK